MLGRRRGRRGGRGGLVGGGGGRGGELDVFLFCCEFFGWTGNGRVGLM